MTANAGYHAYATGDVLTAAQVQYNLQNQTVMYFATTTARDAALTGAILVEGMVSYTPATGVMYYNGSAWTAVGATSPLTTKGDVWGYSTTNARVPVGTNNQVLTADSTTALGVKWASAASSGGMTLLSTTTLSGSSVNITSISQSYKSLYGVIYGCLNNTADGYFSVDTTAAALASYQMKNTTSAVVSTSAAVINLTSWTGSGGAMDHTNAGNAFQFTINNYASTTNFKTFSSTGVYYATSATAYSGTWSSGGIASNTAISDITFRNSGGNFSAGTVLLYGVN